MGRAGKETKQIQKSIYCTVLSFLLSSPENRRNKSTVRYRVQSSGQVNGQCKPYICPALLPAVILLSPSGLTSTHLSTHFTHLLLQSGTRTYWETSTHGLCSFLSTVERMLRIPGIYRLAAGLFPSSKLSPQKVRSLLHFLLLDIGT